MESQEKFVKTVYMLLDIFQSFDDMQMAHRKEIDSRDKASAAAREVSEAQSEMIEKLMESNAALQNAYKETHITVNENSERMERLLAKVEAYFGTSGLDYDN
jgi:allophanate hydrolase subunit 1